jgi:hypothetical protein
MKTCTFPIATYEDLCKEFAEVSDHYRNAMDWQAHESCKGVVTTDSESFDLVRLDKEASTQDAIDDILSRGYRLPNLDDLIIWSRAKSIWMRENCGKQDLWTIVCLGFFCKSKEDRRRTPVLYWNTAGTWLLDLISLEEWMPYHNFLAVRM